MPDHRTHRAIDRRVLGREYPKVHQLKDWPAKFLGTKHRRVLHDLQTNIMIGAMYGPEAFLSSLLHDLADLGGRKWTRKR